jgi:hypothetical protein
MEWRMVQAELLFQNARPADADLMMRGVVRKNPNYAGARPLSQGYSVTLYSDRLTIRPMSSQQVSKMYNIERI